MAEDEIVVACTSVILVSLGAASVMADAMADAKKESANTKCGLVNTFAREINTQHSTH